MTAPEGEKTVPTDCGAMGSAGHDLAWAGWMTLFGVLGILTTLGVQWWVDRWCKLDEFRQSQTWMQEQMEQLRRGEIDCLIQPDPRFVGDLLADTVCAAKIRDLYVGGDLSDPRLGRLRALPNLKCIVFLFADQHSAFLEHLNGMSTIEELTFDHTFLTRKDVEQIGSFPHLKSLHAGSLSQFGNLEGLRGHRSLERLSLAAAAADKGMISVFQSMPHLHALSVGVCHKEKASTAGDSFERLLDQSLPGCKCRVWEDDR
jgi:hypothetical protein